MCREASVTAILVKYCTALPEELSQLVYLVNAQKFSSTHPKNIAGNLDATTPVLFLTSNRDSRSQMKIQTDGANRHLTKPISPTVLRSALLEILENKIGPTAH